MAEYSHHIVIKRFGSSDKKKIEVISKLVVNDNTDSFSHGHSLFKNQEAAIFVRAFFRASLTLITWSHNCRCGRVELLWMVVNFCLVGLATFFCEQSEK